MPKSNDIDDHLCTYCIFVHASGFIGGNKTKAGALEMAIKTIAAHENKSNGA